MGRRKSGSAAFSLFAFQDIITSVTGIMVLITLILALELMNRTEQSPPVQTAQHAREVQSTIAELEAEIKKLESRMTSSGTAIADLPSTDPTTLREQARKVEEDSERLQRDVENKQQKLTKARQKLTSTQSQDVNEKDGEQQELDALAKKIDQLTEKLQDAQDEDRMFFSEGIKDKTTYLVEITERQISAAQIGVKMKPKFFSSVSEFKRWLTGLSPQTDALYLVVKPRGAENFGQIQAAIKPTGIQYGYTLGSSAQKFIDPTVGAGQP